jgi:hypothetical protein
MIGSKKNSLLTTSKRKMDKEATLKANNRLKYFEEDTQMMTDGLLDD